MGDEGTGAGVRGVSGGERKRVTVGIGLVPQPKVGHPQHLHLSVPCMPMPVGSEHTLVTIGLALVTQSKVLLNIVIPALLCTARGHPCYLPDQGYSGDRGATASSVSSALQVLMLDEPTSGLDSETAVAIMQLMQDLTRQVRVISEPSLMTHCKSECLQCMHT